MIVVNGTICRGLRAATTTIALQMPHFERCFPEIRDCHPASINVCLDCELQVLIPDCTTPPIEWQYGQREVFSFLRVGFEYPAGGEPKQAWVYIPHDSPHRQNPRYAEIMSQWLGGVMPGARCRLHLPRGTKQSEVVIV